MGIIGWMWHIEVIEPITENKSNLLYKGKLPEIPSVGDEVTIITGETATDKHYIVKKRDFQFWRINREEIKVKVTVQETEGTKVKNQSEIIEQLESDIEHYDMIWHSQFQAELTLGKSYLYYKGIVRGLEIALGYLREGYYE